MEKINRREALQKSGRMVTGAAACLAMAPFAAGCSNNEKALATGSGLKKKITSADIDNLKITVVYDNNRYQVGLHSDWGFACLIEGLDQTILFDTGRFDSMFMANLANLNLEPSTVDTVFLSHEHPDHVGGLLTLLKHASHPSVYMPDAFTSGMKKSVDRSGSSVVGVKLPEQVTKNSFSTGEMQSIVKNEHALGIDTTGGLVIITGCAHPGVADMVERAQMLMEKEILFVLGGFHLLQQDENSITKIASRFREMGVRYVAPTHCSGGLARDIFKEVYADRYIACGVGRVITAKDFSLAG